MTSLLKRAWVLTLGCVLMATSAAHAVSFDFSSVPGAALVFNGNSTFQFNEPVAGTSPDFVITGPVFPIPSTSIGLTGNIGGLFTIGAVTSNGGVETANVTGTGSFSINDGLNTLNATLTWVNASTVGTFGGFNFTGAINLTGITYTGVNPELEKLRDAGAGIATVSFQFTSATSLSTLKSNSLSTSYSGSVTSAPDGGSAIALLGMGLVALEGFRRRSKLA